MNLLNILIYPDKRLRKSTKNIKNINDNIKKIISDMIYTMYFNNGIGLSAIQVNIYKKIVVIDISKNHNNPLILINPKIIYKSGNINFLEGCLSLPNIFFKINRYNKISVKYININNNEIIINTNGLLSVCIQHEIDHLNGILFIDYLSEKEINKINKIFNNINNG